MLKNSLTFPDHFLTCGNNFKWCIFFLREKYKSYCARLTGTSVTNFENWESLSLIKHSLC